MAFSIFLMGHVISDFLLQPRMLIKAKQESSKILLFQPATLFHVLVYFVLTLMISLVEGAFTLPFLIALFITTVAHYFIDYWKNTKRFLNAMIFMIDQVLHIVSIVLATIFLDLWDFPLNGTELIVMVQERSLGINQVTQINFLTVALVCLIWGTQYFITTVLDSRGKPSPLDGSDAYRVTEISPAIRQRERHISYMERLMILLLVLRGQYVAIMLLLIAKSIIRFPKLKDEVYQEYFMYGTFLSFTCGLIFASFYRYIFTLAV